MGLKPVVYAKGGVCSRLFMRSRPGGRLPCLHEQIASQLALLRTGKKEMQWKRQY